LAPETLARTAPEPDLARFPGPPLRLVVHPAEHEHAVGPRVLDDGRLQHRTGTPSARTSSRRDARRSGSSWRIEASNAACATPSAAATCRALPAPPEAITGTRTVLATAEVRSRS